MENAQNKTLLLSNLFYLLISVSQIVTLSPKIVTQQECFFFGFLQLKDFEQLEYYCNYVYELYKVVLTLDYVYEFFHDFWWPLVSIQLSRSFP